MRRRVTIRYDSRVEITRPAGETGRTLVEDYGLVAVNDYAVAEVKVDGAGEDGLFEVAAFANEVVDGVAVRDADDVLVDDGALIEFGGDVVGGGTDDLHTALVGVVVGAGAGEGGEERVVDVRLKPDPQ